MREGVATAADWARLKAGGYKVRPYNNGIRDVPGWWVLVDPDGHELRAFDRKWEALADGLTRIADNERTP